MYNGIGLQTPRGSGTNGYIQSNRFFVKPKTSKVVVDNSGNGFEAGQGTGGISKKANMDILEHDRKRQIELKLVILEDKLTDQGYTSAEIAEKLAEARRSLEDAAATEAGPISITDKKVSDTQTHQIAARKEKQLEAFRSALKIAGHETEGHRKVNNQDLNSMENNDDHLEDDILDKENTENFEESIDDKDKKIASVKNMTGVLKSHKSKKSEKEAEVGLSDSDSDEKHATRKTGSRYKDTRGSDSEYERGTKVRHEPSATYGKGKRHDSSDSSDSDGENDKDRSRQHKKLAKFEDEQNRIGKKGRQQDHGVASSDDEEYEKTRKGHGRKRRQQDHDDASSGEEEYEKTRKGHGRKRRHDSDDDAGRKNEKNADRHYKKTKESDHLDSSDSERQPRRKKEKTKRHDSDVSDAEDQRHEKTVKKNMQTREDDSNLDGHGKSRKNLPGRGYNDNNVDADNTYRTKDGISWAPRKDLGEKWNSLRKEEKDEEDKRGKKHKRDEKEEEEEVYNHSRWNEGGQDYSPEKEKTGVDPRDVGKINKSARLSTKDELSWATKKELDERRQSSKRDSKDEEGYRGGRKQHHRKEEEEEEILPDHNRWVADVEVDKRNRTKDGDEKRHSSSRREAKDEDKDERGGRKHKREVEEIHDDYDDDDVSKRRRVDESGSKERDRYNGDNNKHGRRQNRYRD